MDVPMPQSQQPSWVPSSLCLSASLQDPSFTYFLPLPPPRFFPKSSFSTPTTTLPSILGIRSRISIRHKLSHRVCIFGGINSSRVGALLKLGPTMVEVRRCIPKKWRSPDFLNYTYPLKPWPPSVPLASVAPAGTGVGWLLQGARSHPHWGGSSECCFHFLLLFWGP